jgi:hyaluronan synthase
MPNTARASSPSLSSAPPSVLGRELLLTPLPDDPRVQRRNSDPSGVRARPTSSMPPPPEQPLHRSEVALRALLAASTVIILAALSWSALVALFGAELSLAPTVVTAFGLFSIVYFAATVVQAIRYAPTPNGPRAYLPSLTVIVPAYNEGPMVRTAIESAIESGYPLDRLEIVAIDDGSKDDTWQHICAAECAYPDIVVAIRQPKNRGKREALRTGFVRARGAFVVTVDSDSSIAPGALEAIVAPMVADEEVAAVAGRVLVLNRETSLLARLLSARFYLTFDLARAAQSMAGAVLCTPGALSAYRTEAVLDVLSSWSTQTFMGQPCTIGEDRALTTWLLRAGFRSVYQRTAVVQTVMPTTLRQAARMLIRWERGNLREDLVLLPLLFTRWRKRDHVWPALEVLFELGQYPVGWLAMTMLVVEAWAHPTVLASVATSLLIGALAQNLYCLRSGAVREFAYGVGYSLVATLGLWWVFPYSLATVGDGRWLTR